MSDVSPERVREFLEPYSEAWSLFTAGRMRGDAWPWVELCMRTRDELRAVRGLPSERLPVPDLPHLRVFTWAWYACPRLVVDKARQMMLTWQGCGLTVNAAMFTPSAREGYQNMTMADTGEKLDRYMLYILTSQPMDLMLPWVEERGHPPEEWVQNVAAAFGLSMDPPNPDAVRADQPGSVGSPAYVLAKHLTNRYRTSSGPEGVETIYLYPFFDPTERVIEGIPAGPRGPNKWRGATRTGANHDEGWFQQSLADNLNSAQKSVGDYGFHRIWTTASMGEDGDAYPLEFIKPARQQPEEFGEAGRLPKLRRDALPEGIELSLTEMGYTHLRIHHFADPDKRGDEWLKRNVYTGDQRKNMREVLIHYNAPSGKPFYPTFDYTRQRETRPSVMPDGAQLWLCADGGRRPAFLAALVHPSGRVHVVMECVTPAGESSNVRARGTEFRGMLNRDPLTRDHWRDATLVCDPSMFDTRGETDDLTSADLLTDLGFQPVRGPMHDDVRYEAVTNLNLLTIPHDKRPALQIDGGACPTVFEGMSGACTVTKNAEKTGVNKKEKNAASHPVEALEYLAAHLDGNPIQTDDDLDMLLRMVHQPGR